MPSASSSTQSNSNESILGVIANSYNISIATTYSIFSYGTTAGNIPHIDGYYLNIKAMQKVVILMGSYNR